MFSDNIVVPTVDVLTQLAGGGSALEFGVGRVASHYRSLAAVSMSTASTYLARVARLRAKPGGSAVSITIGDFATTRAAGEFSLVYLLFNTICNLTTQDAQVACFLNAAEHLTPGGTFVTEVGVPALRLLPPGQRAVPFAVGNDGWAYDRFDCATQATSSNYIDEDAGRTRLRSTPFRYVWPAELDLDGPRRGAGPG